jgi:hypothetical protein
MGVAFEGIGEGQGKKEVDWCEESLQVRFIREFALFPRLNDSGVFGHGGENDCAHRRLRRIEGSFLEIFSTDSVAVVV